MNTRQVDPAALALGYAGLLPFVAGAVLIWFEEPVNPFFVLQAFHVYSIMVLAFLCGTWWGFAFSDLDRRLRRWLLLASNVLFVSLWLVMLFLPSLHTLAVLGLAYAILLLPELGFRELPVDAGYRRMRIILTAVVMLCHLSVFLNVSGMIAMHYPA
jgi:hypothetical protein